MPYCCLVLFVTVVRVTNEAPPLSKLGTSANDHARFTRLHQAGLCYGRNGRTNRRTILLTVNIRSAERSKESPDPANGQCGRLSVAAMNRHVPKMNSTSLCWVCWYLPMANVPPHLDKDACTRAIQTVFSKGD
ncbi:hypothetical protein CIB48_g10790 [Xylaria polymorpha]|nr:hypothetical protein CIB48_g10790 [Xylaria polymorpha]